MSIVKDSDLFDFDGYKASLKDLQQHTEQWAQSTVSWIDRIKTSYSSAEKELTDLESEFKNFNVAQKDAANLLTTFDNKINDAARRIETARQAQINLTQAQELNGKVITDLTTRLTGLKQRYDSLDPAQKDYQKQQRAILNETRTVTRAIDAQSKSLQLGTSVIKSAENSYNGLKRQTTDLKKQLDGLEDAYDRSTGKINEQNRAAVRLNEQYQKNIALLSKIEQGQRNFRGNVGNYPNGQGAALGGSAASSLAGVASMAGRFAGAGLALAGVDSAFESLQKIGEITLQFDSLDSALQVVSNDTALFTQRQAMLQRVSENLGQDLAVVERNYTNLTASSKGTRLEGEATDKIFESIVGTMARLKKPSEDVNRALLAVGQMMSKGTVQSEELRGQIGEVLPSAFSIAARSMGVTTSKLSDMLKNGEVLASDLLPKFALELERTFNPNNERRVEGLGANLARLRNEGVAWVKSINIGDAAGEFIGNITSMARSVREFFSSSVEQSTARLAEQTEAMNRLESAMPGLLSRYDELKAKSKLSADEQKELQTVVNDLVRLAPSAATGFDAYGNALDVNKGKVLSFAAAQRELNAELNKQAITDLRKQTTGNMQRAAQTQGTLNRGTEQKSFNFKPYFLQTDEERRQSTDKNAGKRREVALSDDRKRGLQGQLQDENKQIELGIMQRLQLGDKLTEADAKYIDESGNAQLKRIKVVEDYNTKIAELEGKQVDLYIKGDKTSQKQRDAVLKELKTYQDKKRAILSPTLPTSAVAEDDRAAAKKAKAAEAARKKEQSQLDRQLRDALSKSEATSGKELAILDNQHQDGLIGERAYIEKRLQLTLDGLNGRQALLERSGKKESDDYQKVLEAKTKADADYKRAQLQLDLKASKGRTTEGLATVEADKSEGVISEIEAADRRHAITVAGIREEQTILREAGQEKTELFRATNEALTKEDADYYKRRIKILRAEWKQELAETKDGLALIDQTIAADLADNLNKIEEFYRKKRQQVELDVKRGQLSPTEGQAQVHQLAMSQINDELHATESAYAKDRQLSAALIDDKIKLLRDYMAVSGRTDAEIQAAKDAIAELEKARDKDAADDKKKLNKEVADNTKKTDDESFKHQSDNVDKLNEKRKILWQKSLELASTIGDATFSVVAGNVDREQAQLDRRYETELKLAGDNADAKKRIEEDYAKRKAEIQRKQAIADRAQALFNIAINTAMGVASVLSTGGGTRYADFGISAGILSAFVIATGALQAAAVLSKPLPAYKIGKHAWDSYTGPALAGEAGTELRTSRDGSIDLIDKPTIIHTKPGDRIYPAWETSQILADWQRQQSTQQALQQMQFDRASVERLQAGRLNEQVIVHTIAGASNGGGLTEAQAERAFGKALDARPQRITEIDEDGFREYLEKGKNRTEYINRRRGTGR